MKEKEIPTICFCIKVDNHGLIVLDRDGEEYYVALMNFSKSHAYTYCFFEYEYKWLIYNKRHSFFRVLPLNHGNEKFLVLRWYKGDLMWNTCVDNAPFIAVGR